jgi:hypothetical protein
MAKPVYLEKLKALDAQAEHLEREIRHARCCGTRRDIKKIVQEWALLQLKMSQIESGGKSLAARARRRK